jgi:hypothetical protein
MNISDRPGTNSQPLLTAEQEEFLKLIVSIYQSGNRSVFRFSRWGQFGHKYVVIYPGSEPLNVSVDFLDLRQLAQKDLIAMTEFKHGECCGKPTATGIGVAGRLNCATIVTIEDARSDSTYIDLKRHRAAMLADFKKRNGIQSDRAIYNLAGKFHSCHKAQFLEWKKGTLPPDSQTCISLENFLKEGRMPSRHRLEE